MEEEIIFQENLERLENGESLENVLAGLWAEQAAQLRLVHQIQSLSQHARNPQVVANQHEHVMQLWEATEQGENMWNPKTILKRLIPAGALFSILIAFVVIAGGLLWLGNRDTRIAKSNPGGEIVRIPSGATAPVPVGTSEPASGQNPSAGIVPGDEPFPPLVVPNENPPTVSGPKIAVLKTIHGIVQLQQADNSWQTVETIEIQAGHTFRTWDYSSAVLYFYDGSSVSVDANTRLTLVSLQASRQGSREIVLFQPYGETHHTVTPGSPESYVVRTPSASGTAKGTKFQVVVKDDKSSQFTVEEGIVAVQGKKNSVELYSGEMTSVAHNDDPVEPVFWITGQGEVTQVGEVWVIGGQTFQTHEGTVILGNPQVGDLVSVRGRLLPDGTRLADRIILLTSSHQEQFRLTGVVEVIGDGVWTISGQEIQVDGNTQIDEGIEIGSRVQVTGSILEGGILLAAKITLLGDLARFEFTGLVEQIDEGAWTISGVVIVVDQQTEIKGNPGVGDLVKVEGQILPDGTWLAREIEKISEPDDFEFTGTVQSITPWVVSGISFEVNEFTQIEPGIIVGSTVHVEGMILEDGTWLASSIALLDETNTLVFIGIVDSAGPWVVNGLSLTVDENTVFNGEIVIGSLVRVEVMIQSDGAWLVVSMELIETGPVVGCIEFVDVVTALSREGISLANSLVIPLSIAEIEGDPAIGSQVYVKLCFGPENVIVFALVIVLQDHPRPTATPPAPRPTDSPPDAGKVTICHIPAGKSDKAKTITVDASAVAAHLAHGDSLGSCQGDDEDEDKDKGDHDEDGDDDEEERDE